MRDIVPPDFEPLLPEKPEPKFKYAIEKSGMISFFFFFSLQYLKLVILFHFILSVLPGQFLSNTLLTKIRNKTTPEDILEILKEPLMSENGEIMEPADICISNPTKIDAFIQTLLYIASKSFSHAFAAITKFISVFKVCIIIFMWSVTE